MFSYNGFKKRRQESSVSIPSCSSDCSQHFFTGLTYTVVTDEHLHWHSHLQSIKSCWLAHLSILRENWNNCRPFTQALGEHGTASGTGRNHFELWSAYLSHPASWQTVVWQSCHQNGFPWRWKLQYIPPLICFLWLCGCSFLEVYTESTNYFKKGHLMLPWGFDVSTATKW